MLKDICAKKIELTSPLGFVCIKTKKKLLKEPKWLDEVTSNKPEFFLKLFFGKGFKFFVEGTKRKSQTTDTC